MESNEEIIEILKNEVKEELKNQVSETSLGYVHVFNKRLEEKLKEKGIEVKKEDFSGKLID